MLKSEPKNVEARADNMRVSTEPAWNQIDWQKLEKTVEKMQARIVKAQQEGRFGKVKSLSRVLTRSFAAKALAVRQVTSNKGSRTPGIDNVLWTTNEQKSKAIMELKHEDYKAKPLKRKYIKKKNGKMRPLGIPTMKDRAMQALHALALKPIAEATADANSYGFRPERSCIDAIEQIKGIYCRKKTSPQWVLEADIKGCFDNISHTWILEHVPVEKRILTQWLKSGYIDDNSFFLTESGTPQGGIISPIIANMVLDGLEEMLNSKYKVRHMSYGKPTWASLPKERNQKINFVRYADDFVISGVSKEVLENEVKPMVREFLKERGLELSEEKTLITNISDGFDFLGFNIRTYNGKLVIKPSKKSVKTFYENVNAVFERYKTVRADLLIKRLNPLIRGWANYYRHVASSETFSKVSHRIWKKTWKWSVRRHQKKSKTWVKNKYYTKILNRNWIFFGEDETGKRITLFEIKGVKILRHRKIYSDANPYALEWREYFVQRKEPGNKLRRSPSKGKSC